MAIPAINVLGNPNVTEGNFQIAIEDLRKSVIGSGKAYDSANTYSQYDTCVYSGVVYYSKINSNTGNTPAVGTNWGLIGDLITGVVHNVGNESIDGTKTFTTSPIVPTPTTTGNIITMDNIVQKTPVGIGYGTGSGGVVTQLTSKSTTVTLNKPTGFINMSIGELAAGASATFTFNNSLLSGSDTLNIGIYSDSIATQGSYRLTWSIKTSVAYITLTNQSASALNEAPLLYFTIIKGAIS